MTTKFSFVLAAAASLAYLNLVASSPSVLSLDFAKEVNREARSTNRLARRQHVQSDITNEELLYIINATIGTPPQPFSLQLDTGSSDIWVPSILSNACSQNPDSCKALGAFNSNASSTFTEIARGLFSIHYVDGTAIRGDYVSDVFTMGKTAVQNMTMAVATTASRPVGIMGIGFDSGESIAAQDPMSIYPNIISELKNQSFIKTTAYSLWLNDLDSNTGSILFGGVDTAKYHGDLIGLPIQPDGQTGTLTSFTVALTNISIADSSGKIQYVALPQGTSAVPVILDSGTTDTYLPDDIANTIIQGVGASIDPNLGAIAPCNLSMIPASFAFTFGGPNGPVINVSLSEFITPIITTDGSTPTFTDGSPACQFGIQPSAGNPNLFGDTFLRSAYVVYDLQNTQIALANTNFNASGSNIVEFTGDSIPGVSAVASEAVAAQTNTGIPLATVGNPTVTAAPTKLGGAGGQRTVSFNLGTPTATVGKKSAGSALQAPGVERMTIVTGGIVLASFLFGGSLLWWL